MPAPALIDWQGFEVRLEPDGSLALKTNGHTVLSGFTVQLPPPWEQVLVECEGDEIEQLWKLGSARALVRQVFDATWTIRVNLENTSQTAPIEVPGVRWQFDAAWPAAEWLAGNRAVIVVELKPPDLCQGSVGVTGPQLLALVQKRGEARLIGGERWLTPPRLRLGVRGEVTGRYLVSWHSEVVQERLELAGLMPVWWPTSTALQKGDELILDLPDAALTSESIETERFTGDHGLVLLGEPGEHLVAVHEASGTTDLELAWAEDTDVELGRRARLILDRVDPRQSTSVQAWLVDRAAARLVLGGREAEEFLDDFLDRAAGDCMAADPFAVGLLAHWASLRADQELTRAAVRLAGELAPQPGARLAWLGVLPLAVGLFNDPSVGGVPDGFPSGWPSLPPEPGVAPFVQAPDKRVDLALQRCERFLVEQLVHAARNGSTVTQSMPFEVERLAALLGPVLPKLACDPVTAAQLWQLLSMVPEGWRVGGWPRSLGQIRDEAQRRLIASSCPDLALAWLVW